MKNKYLILSLVFCFGYITSDIVTATGLSLGSTASAEVGGMDSYGLANDFDFKKAVKKIVERNYDHIDDNEIKQIIEGCTYSGAYVKDGYIYGGNLSC